jgi:polar amino acid transport system substrate-binding protein
MLPKRAISDANARLQTRNFRREIVDGLRLLFGHPLLRLFLSQAALVNVGAGIFLSMLPLFLLDRIGVASWVFGLLSSLGAVSGVAASLVCPALRRRFGEIRMTVLFSALAPVAVLPAPLAAVFPSAAVPLVGSAEVLIAFVIVGRSVAAAGLRAGHVDRVPGPGIGRQQRGHPGRDAVGRIARRCRGERVVHPGGAVAGSRRDVGRDRRPGGLAAALPAHPAGRMGGLNHSRRAGERPTVGRVEITADIVTDLAPTGALRASINQGNPVLVQGTPDAPTGVTVDLAREIGRRLGVPVELLCFDAARKSYEAMATGRADLCFLAVDPKREESVTFTAPYVEIEGVYAVPQDSAIGAIEDVDRPGVRVGVNQGSAYDLFLTRTLRHATLVRGDDGIDEFLDQGLEVVAGIRQPMTELVAARPEFRLVDGAFMRIRQAVGTTKSRGPATVAFLRELVEQLRASGFVAESLRRAHQSDALVAPQA